MDDGVFAEMELSDNNDGADFGQELDSQIEIDDNNHPLAGGIDDDDEIDVTNQDEDMNFLEEEGDGEEILSLAASGETAAAVWEEGDEGLDDRTVPARRVAYFMTDQFTDDLRADGELLLEAAMIFTLTGSDRL